MSYLSDLRLIVSGSTSPFSLLTSILTYPTLPLHLPPIPSSPSPPPTSDDTCPALIPRMFRAGCSHHRFDGFSPRFLFAARHKPMIGQVIMYCTTMFWKRAIYTSISSSPTFSIAAPMGGYIHDPPHWCLGIMPAIRHTAHWWKPLRAFSSRGVIAHISDPNRSTACTTTI